MDNQNQRQGREAPNYDFSFDYKLMTPTILAICNSPQTVTSKDFRMVVKLLGPFCKANKPANVFMTTYINSVTYNFVRRFQKFMDTHNGKVVNLGNDTLQTKVYCWVENNRPDRSEGDLPKRKKREESKLSLLVLAPPMEDFDLCSRSKDTLKEIFHSGERFDSVQVRALMTESYPLQRSEINDHNDKSTLVKHLLEQWPFLFHPIGAAVHFTCGSDINPNTELDSFLRGDITPLRYYLIHKSGPTVSKVDLESQQHYEAGRDPRGISMIRTLHMLAAHFKEDLESLFVMIPADVQVPEWDEAMANIPSTPCLVGAGTNPYQCPSFIVMVNGIRVMGPLSALQGLRVIFPLHIILSIDYNEKVKKTCQFYERCILDYPPVYKVSCDVSKTLIGFNRFKQEME